MADILLTMAVCVTQIMLGYMGVQVSLKPPKPEHHKHWIAAFVLVGASGIFLTAWLAKRAGDAQVRANSEIHEAQIAAMGADTAATNANAAATEASKSATEAQKETKTARQEAKDAEQSLSDLINKRSKETSQALVKLNSTTESSVKGIPKPRRIPPEMRGKLLADLSAHKGVIKMICVAQDAEAGQFARDWYGILSEAGWTIKDGIDGIAMGMPPVGVILTIRGTPVGPGESMYIPPSHPASALGRSLSAVTDNVAGQRDPNLPDNEVKLLIGALPSVNR